MKTPDDTPFFVLGPDAEIAPNVLPSCGAAADCDLLPTTARAMAA